MLMAMDVRQVQFLHHDGQQAERLLVVLCDVYADAYGVEPGGKVEAFRGRATQALAAAGYDLVTAISDGETVGFAFGYALQPGSRWWEGLDPDPPEGFAEETGTRTVVLSEIEVQRAWQRQGLGRRLQDEFLAGRREERATLATGTDVPSRFVYQQWGWEELGIVPGAEGDYFAGYRLFVLSLPVDQSR
jgi:GNAT superfamily N-acetyltransferase